MVSLHAKLVYKGYPCWNLGEVVSGLRTAQASTPYHAIPSVIDQCYSWTVFTTHKNKLQALYTRVASCRYNATNCWYRPVNTIEDLKTKHFHDTPCFFVWLDGCFWLLRGWSATLEETRQSTGAGCPKPSPNPYHTPCNSALQRSDLV